MADLEKIKSKPQLGFFGQNDPESSFLFVHKDSTWEWGKMLSSTLYIQDYRDFQTYKQFEFIDQGDTITWISDNINYDGVNSWQYKNKGWYSEKFGRLYRWEEAQKVCPSGWKLPSVEDWEKLAQVHGGYQDQFSSSKNGSPEKAYRLLTKTGFDFFEAKLGGVRLTDGGFQDMDKKGFYWTSTPVEGDSSKAFAFMFSKRRNGKVVNILKDAVPKANAFSCRCVKE